MLVINPSQLRTFIPPHFLQLIIIRPLKIFKASRSEMQQTRILRYPLLCHCSQSIFPVFEEVLAVFA